MTAQTQLKDQAMQTTDKTPATAWEMSRSLLSGLEQTLEKAREEYAAIRAENPDKPYLGGGTRQLIEALIDTKRSLEPDLHKIAKSNDWDL